MTLRILRKTGMTFLKLGLALVGIQWLLSLHWLPRGPCSVILFAVGGLTLIPLGLAFLLAASYVLTRQRRGESPDDSAERVARGQEVTAALALTLTTVLWVLCVWQFLFPAFSRRLEWGRHGFPPPVTLRSVEEITDLLGIRFPQGTHLESGEYIGGPGVHLRAVLTLPSSEVHGFLIDNKFDWGDPSDELSHGRQLLESAPPEAFPGLERKAVAAFALASFPRPTDFLWVAVEEREAEQSMLHLYWLPTE